MNLLLSCADCFLFLENMLWQEGLSSAVLRLMLLYFLCSVMGGQSLCPASRESLYWTYPATQEAPTSGGEPRRMMWVFSEAIQEVFLLTVTFEVTAPESSAWKKRARGLSVCTSSVKWTGYWNPGFSSFAPKQSVVILKKYRCCPQHLNCQEVLAIDLLPSNCILQ